MASSNHLLFLMLVLFLGFNLQKCYGYGFESKKTFGYEIHHRYSDHVKGVLPVDDDEYELPVKGSVEYYHDLIHRDSVIHGRRLASDQHSLLTFTNGNMTSRFSSLGFLHYANVSVGTPSLWFLVALDTGSDLFWLPCDCVSCVHGLVTRSGRRIDLNIYSPGASSTSVPVPCNSTLCEYQRQCSSTLRTCPYKVSYLSNNTSSTGTLVEDLLHMTTDDNHLKAVDVPITFGCGMVQTGSFLKGAAPNGLFGLGIENVSVPSVLANKGLATNSFSMCFGADGIGRITFGDNGDSDQRKTPFNILQTHPTYNVSVTRTVVGEKSTDLSLSAIFDTGTSFTYLNDPAYTLITESFNSQVQEKRQQLNQSIPFEFCYDVSANRDNFTAPLLNLTMAGGDSLSVTDPLIYFSTEDEQYFYCLGVLKSGDVDIIGQNFMTGYRLVFDRDNKVLGWKESNCYDSTESTILPINPNSTAVPPAIVPANPQATEGPSGGLKNPSATTSPPPSSSTSSRSRNLALTLVFISSFLAIF